MNLCIFIIHQKCFELNKLTKSLFAVITRPRSKVIGNYFDSFYHFVVYCILSSGVLLL